MFLRTFLDFWRLELLFRRLEDDFMNADDLKVPEEMMDPGLDISSLNNFFAKNNMDNNCKRTALNGALSVKNIITTLWNIQICMTVWFKNSVFDSAKCDFHYYSCNQFLIPKSLSKSSVIYNQSSPTLFSRPYNCKREAEFKEFELKFKPRLKYRIH